MAIPPYCSALEKSPLSSAAGGGTFDVYGTITIYAGTFDGGSGLYVAAGAVCELVNSADVQLGTRLYNLGTINVHGNGGLKVSSTFENQGVINWQLPLAIALGAGFNPAADIRSLSAQSFLSKGLIAGVNPNTIRSGIISDNSAGVISNDGGSLVAPGGGSIITQDGGGLLTQDGGGLISQDGGGLVASGGGNAISVGGRSPGAAAASSTNDVREETAATSFNQTGGSTDLSSVSIVGPVTLDGGVLLGSGHITGDLTNNGGYLTPGVITINGNFAQASGGTLTLANGGANPSQFAQLRVSSAASLGGKLDVKLTNSYTPDPADTSNPIGYSSVTGSFASISANAQVSVSGTGLLATVNPAIPSPSAGQPLNIATRLQIPGGDNLLIGGFIINGPAGSTKKVLIRGLGPTLGKYGVPGPLADPLLELHDASGGLIVANDNWQEGDVSQIPADYRKGIDPLDSIVVATLTVGSNGSSNYTAILKGARGETGVGLAEVYDLDPASTAKLANIATRGLV